VKKQKTKTIKKERKRKEKMDNQEESVCEKG